jgi:hypothetical protein
MLQDHNIREGSTIHCLRCLCGGTNIDEAMIAAYGWEGATTFVYIMTLMGKTIQLPVNVDEIIDNVKTHIQDKEGIPPGEKNGKFRK